MRVFNAMFFASTSQPVAGLQSQSSRAVETCRIMELLRGLYSLGNTEHHQALHLSLPSDFFKDLVISLSGTT